MRRRLFSSTFVHLLQVFVSGLAVSGAILHLQLARGAAGPAAAPSCIALGEREQSFFSAVALLGREQVALGKQALRRSSHPEVRRLAQQTINAFIRMGGQLITLAEAKGVVLPTELDAAQRAEMDALAATDAGAFDALYLTMQQRGQNQLTTLFVGQAQGPGDRQLTTWAQNALPQLEAHGRRLAATQRAAQAAQGVQTAEDAP